MRSVDAINGEIGQLRGQIRKHEARIADLYKEVAEVEMTAKGFKIGQTVEWPNGSSKKKGVIVGFVWNYGSTLLCKPILKNGSFGHEINVPLYRLDGIVIHTQDGE